jgi:hypothetical protein
MRDWWQTFQQMVEGLIDEEVDADDPALLFHLLFIAPLFIGIVVLARS